MGWAPDSTQPGYLGPTTQTLEGDGFDDFMQEVVVGITALDPTLVRPRWQQRPPTTPAIGTDWCALGVMEVSADWMPWVGHDDTADSGLGVDTMRRHERVRLLASFYGPNAQGNAALLRDGLFVDQNLALLRANAIGVIEVGEITRTAELFRQQFRERSDIYVILKREVVRTYTVRNLLRSTGTITGTGSAVITVPFDTNEVP